MEWSARLVKKSDLEMTGMAEFTYDLLKGESVVFEKFTFSDFPDKRSDRVKQKLAELRDAELALSEITEDEVITL